MKSTKCTHGEKEKITFLSNLLLYRIITLTVKAKTGINAFTKLIIDCIGH